MTKLRMPLIAACITIFCFLFISSASALNTSWQLPERPRLNVDTAKSKGHFYIVRLGKSRCGQTVQLRINKNGRWGRWKNIACQRGRSNFAAPSVTVDQTNQRVFVVWAQTSILRPEFNYTAYRVSTNRGRSFRRGKILSRLRAKTQPAAITSAADKGVLWVMWQRPRELTDQRPPFALVPYNQINGQPLRSSLVRNSRIFAADETKGRAKMKLFATNGQVSFFWVLSDIGGKRRWYAADSTKYNNPRSARRARVQFRGKIDVPGRQTFFLGDDQQIYRTLEIKCIRCRPDPEFAISIERWSKVSHSFDRLRTIIGKLLPTLGKSLVAFGADQQSNLYLAYQNPLLALEQKPTCRVLYQGIHWCVRSVAPGPSVDTLFMQKFTADGQLEGAPQAFVYPFAARALPGSDVQEWVSGPTGIETITSFLSGDPQLIFTAGHEDISRAGGIGSEIKLNVIISDPFKF